MAIIEKTLDDIRNYIANNAEVNKYNKDKALSVLKLFECPQVAKNSAMQAVVGFSEDNTPLFWDMTKGNLFATCFTGVGMNYMGSTTVLVSLILRFTPEEFKYYLLVDEYAPKYLRCDEHCAGNVSAMFEEREKYFNCLEELEKQLKYRATLSADELSKLPFLLVVLGNPWRYFSDGNIKRFGELFSLLLSICNPLSALIFSQCRSPLRLSPPPPQLTGLLFRQTPWAKYIRGKARCRKRARLSPLPPPASSPR